MKVSLKWLRSMVEVPHDSAIFAKKLDLTGTAVDEVYQTGASLEGIVVGHILKRERHPNADTLWVTTVDVGAHSLGEDGLPEPLQIVCGAQNFDAGDKVPVALMGATLPGGIKIKKSKLRGVESRGMNCSVCELGLGTDADGIMILPEDAPVGAAFSEYWGTSDTVFDLEITPNRPDCMSMLGVAREVAAVYDTTYEMSRVVPEPLQRGRVEDLVTVRIDDVSRSARYTARVIQGIKIGPSPQWLVECVTAAGARSINNIVDITNYIMYETGQPLHAFDLDTLVKDAEGKASIVVRAAADGEKFTTLDNIERTLSSDITVIVDGNAAVGSAESSAESGTAGGSMAGAASGNTTSGNAAGGSTAGAASGSAASGNTTSGNAADGAGATIALAGVMGGLESEVTDATVNILLEAATFDAAHTSRTSRNLKLFSESSSRYERGVDDATCSEFSARAAALMAELGGGTVAEGVVDCYLAPREIPVLTLRMQQLCTLLGVEIAAEDAVGILERLGCVVKAEAEGVCQVTPPTLGEESKGDPAEGEGVYQVTPPSYRPDLEREVDLYEEVLRIWGMDRVASRLPGGEGRIGARTTEQVNSDKMGAILRAQGLNETMTYVFASAHDNELIGAYRGEGAESVELINPLSSEQSLLRMSIIPGLLRSVAYNQSHGVSNVQLYELGAVFTTGEGRKLPKERPLLAGVLAGSWVEQGWDEHARSLDFFDGKGVIENLARELCIPKLRFVALAPEDAPWLADGQAAQVRSGSIPLGWIGVIHPRVAAAYDAASPVVAFELEVKALLDTASEVREFMPIPVYPAVEFDLAIVVDTALPAEKLVQVARSAGGKLLEEVRIFDVFTSEEKLGAHKKSVALALRYRSLERTLTSEEIEKLHGKVIRKLEGATGGEIRS